MAVAVICEFNPFHNGHKYLLNQAKKLSGEDVIAVMSGSFTQRGEASVCGKFSRARAAIRGGADLVVELPCVYAVASAERFAAGGVRIAKAFGCVSRLAFGCEEDNLDLLLSVSRAEKNPDAAALIKKYMDGGDYYPRAFSRAVGAVLGGAAAKVTEGSNNLLALEYLKALDGSRVSPLPIRRIGVEHNGALASGGFASASLIREKLLRGDDVSAFVPEPTGELVRPENLERAILSHLRRMSADELKRLPEVKEGLENRIYKSVRESVGMEELLDKIKTKRYTHARLRRIIACAFLGITEELQSREVCYARVLAMNGRGAKLLKDFDGEVVTSFAKGMKNEEIAPFLEKDALATDLAALGYDAAKPCSGDYLTKISVDIC